MVKPRKNTPKKTDRETRNGISVSITPNQWQQGEKTYKIYRVRYRHNGKLKSQTAKTLEEAQKIRTDIFKELKTGEPITLTLSQKIVIHQVEEILFRLSADLGRPRQITITEAINAYSEAERILPTGVTLTEAARHYVRSTAKSSLIPITLPKLAAKYIQTLREEGLTEIHIKTTSYRLAKASEYFHCPVADITREQINEWLQGLKDRNGKPVAPQTRAHHRSAIKALFRYAQQHRHLSSESVTEAEFAREVKVPSKAVEAYTPQEAQSLMANMAPEWKAYTALGLFAGIRPQELFNLTWEDIKKDHIEITAKDSKTDVRRIVPLLPNLSAWIKGSRKASGPICPVYKGGDDSRAQFLSKAMRAAAAAGKFKVIRDGLRHSFISYRVADIQNLDQVALEAGNSRDVIQEHYHKRTTPTEAKKYFAIMPKNTPKNVIAFAA